MPHYMENGYTKVYVSPFEMTNIIGFTRNLTSYQTVTSFQFIKQNLIINENLAYENFLYSLRWNRLLVFDKDKFWKWLSYWMICGYYLYFNSRLFFTWFGPIKNINTNKKSIKPFCDQIPPIITVLVSLIDMNCRQTWWCGLQYSIMQVIKF